MREGGVDTNKGITFSHCLGSSFSILEKDLLTTTFPAGLKKFQVIKEGMLLFSITIRSKEH